MKPIFSLVFIFLSMVTPGVAQELSDSIPTVMVTASQIPSPTAQTGKSITVLRGEDFRNTTATSVDELLTSLPGLHLNTRNAFGVQADIGMRGSTFSQVLILIDGVRLNDPLTAHFNNNIPVSLAEIGQIEIIRGPASASFGTDAVGGVIHIKTKSYLRTFQRDEFSLSGDVGLGANRLFRSNIGMLYQKKKLILSTGVQTNISDGETLVNPNFTQGISTDSLYQNFFDVRTYSASLSYLFNDQWNVFVRGNTTQRAFSAKYFYTQSLYDESTEETRSDNYQMTLRHRGEHHRTALTYSHKNTDDLFIFNPLFTPNQHQTIQQILNFTHYINPASKVKIALGAQLLQQEISSTDRGNHKKTTGGLFANLAYPILPGFMATAGIRLAYDPLFGLKPVPQLNLAYTTNQLTLRSSFGTAIRSADFTEQYISSQIPNLSAGRNIGNPDLKWEQSITGDIGADWTPSPSSNISTSIFFRQSKNLIDYTLTNSSQITNASNLLPNEVYLYANNIATSKTVGLEFHAQKRIAFQNYKINLEGNYTYLKTTTPEGIISKYIANHPRHNFTGDIKFVHPYFELSTSLQYLQRTADFVETIGGEISKNLFLIHGRLSIHPKEKSFSFYIQINNMTNINYQFIPGAPLPKRWWMVGLQFSIAK